MKRPLAIALALTLLPALAGCGDSQTGTHIGNPTATFVLTVATSDPAPAGTVTFRDDNDLLYSLTQARAYVRRIELYLPAGTTCDDVASDLVGALCEPDESGDFKVRIPGPFAVDLLARTTTPSLETVRIPALTYRRVDVRIDDGDPADGVIPPGDELDGVSLRARADFVYQDVPVVLELSLRFNEEVRFEDASGVPVGEAGRLLAALDVAAWLADLALGDCLDDGDLIVQDGRLLIDDQAGGGGCSDVEQVIRQNIAQSGRLSVE